MCFGQPQRHPPKKEMPIRVIYGKINTIYSKPPPYSTLKKMRLSPLLLSLDLYIDPISIV